MVIICIQNVIFRCLTSRRGYNWLENTQFSIFSKYHLGDIWIFKFNKVYFGRNLLEPKTVSIEQKLKVTAWNTEIFAYFLQPREKSIPFWNQWLEKIPWPFHRKKSILCIFSAKCHGDYFFKIMNFKILFSPLIVKSRQKFQYFLEAVTFSFCSIATVFGSRRFRPRYILLNGENANISKVTFWISPQIGFFVNFNPFLHVKHLKMSF